MNTKLKIEKGTYCYSMCLFVVSAVGGDRGTRTRDLSDVNRTL